MDLHVASSARVERLDQLRGDYSDLKVRFFYNFGAYAARGNNPFVLLFAGAALFAAIMPGIIYYRTEDDFSKLYVYQKSRVQASKHLH